MLEIISWIIGLALGTVAFLLIRSLIPAIRNSVGATVFIFILCYGAGITLCQFALIIGIIIGIIALCALIGFFRGYLKTNHYMIASLIIYVIGIILMKPVVRSLLYMDVSFINNYVSGLNIETPMKYITELIIEQYPSVEGLLVNDSYTLALEEGVASLVLNIVYLLLLFVLSLTVFHLISGIIWLIVKKPLVRKFGKQKGFKKNGKPKYKKPITSRLYGLVLGGVKGMLYTLLIGFIIAGVLSMVDSLKTIDGSKEMVVVCVEDTFTVVELSESNEVPDNENENSLIDDSIYQLLHSYRISYIFCITSSNFS